MNMRTRNGYLHEPNNNVYSHTRFFCSLSRHPELFSIFFGNILNLRIFTFGKSLNGILRLEGGFDRAGEDLDGRVGIWFFCMEIYRYFQAVIRGRGTALTFSDQPFCSIEIFIRSIVHISNSLRYIIIGKIDIMYEKKWKSKIHIE